MERTGFKVSGKFLQPLRLPIQSLSRFCALRCHRCILLCHMVKFAHEIIDLDQSLICSMAVTALFTTLSDRAV